MKNYNYESKPPNLFHIQDKAAPEGGNKAPSLVRGYKVTINVEDWRRLRDFQAGVAGTTLTIEII